MEIRYFDEFERVIQSFAIQKEDVCIVGSSVLASCGLRENHDVDFAIRPGTREALLEQWGGRVELLPSGTINFSQHVQSLFKRYEKIGITNADLFESDKYTSDFHGYRIAGIEIEIAQKQERNMKKDIKDLAAIGKDYSKIPGFDMVLYQEVTAKKRAIIYGAGARAGRIYNVYSGMYDIECFVDRDQELWGMKIKGVPVCSPDVLSKSDACVIISSSRYEDEIKRELYEKYGAKKIVKYSLEDI